MSGARLARFAWVPSVLVALLTWCLYFPSAVSVVQLSPDSVEFVDVARRLAAGEGYVLGIKAYHLGDGPVIHDGLTHRPPLFPLVVAGLLRLDFGLPTAQVVNALFGAVSAAMVCSIGTALFGRVVGISAGVLAAANPIAFEQQIPLLSDALATALTLVAVRLLIRAVDRLTAVPAVFAGVAFGLGYLTRPPVLVIWAALLLLFVCFTAARRPVWHIITGMFVGTVAVCAPVTAFSLLTRGRLSYSGKGYLYGVVSDADVMENGYATLPLSPADFILSNPGFVAGSIWTVLTLYGRALFVEREWLAPLAIGWPGALLASVRGQYPWTATIALVAAAANFLFYGLTWSSWQDRFMLTTLFLLLPFAVDGLLRSVRWLVGQVPVSKAPPRFTGRLPVFVLGLIVACVLVLWMPRFLSQYRGEYRYGERPAGTRVNNGLRWTGPPRWVNDGSLDQMIQWIEGQTDRDTILAHGQPWPYTFFTGRPTVLLPYRLSDSDLERFLVEYRVSYVLFDPRDPQRRRYRDQLRELEDQGVRSQHVESMIVFDTRPLWRTPASGLLP